MAVDRNSPEFLLGQNMARLEAGDKTMQALTDGFKEVSQALNSLPCDIHERRIDDVNKWRQDCESHNIRQAGFRIKFWHGALLILMTVILNALVSLLLGSVL